MPKLLLVLLILQASSAPQQTKTPTEPARAAVEQPRGSDSLPVSVKLLSSGQTAAEAAERAKQVESEQRIADRAFEVAMVTAGIYFVTLLVLVFQSFQLKRATALTQRSVEVAKTTARRQLKAYGASRYVS